MADELDSLVKGAPMPGQDVKHVSGTTPIISEPREGDPLSHTPCSPAMIYHNLLILEASMRAQYLELRARRRHHTFFLLLLAVWIAGFTYARFFAPREDGVGLGGSVYWGVEVAENVCLLGGIITALLVRVTGVWDRAIKWPRKWFLISNRGLRGFNCKLVLIKRPWWAELGSTLAFFLTYGVFSHTASSSYRFVEAPILREVDKEIHARLGDGSHPNMPSSSDDVDRVGRDEDLAPGGDYVKLLLLPKQFTASFRESWEIYRLAYWERENERRALILEKLKKRDREYAKHRWGVLWWLPWHQAQLERHLTQERIHAHVRRPAIEREHKEHKEHKEHRHHRSGSVRRRSSTSSSRSHTPLVEGDDGVPISRRGSTASATSEKRKKRLSTASRPRQRPESRSVTPEIPSPLHKESSMVGGASSGGEAEKAVRKVSSKGSMDSGKERWK